MKFTKTTSLTASLAFATALGSASIVEAQYNPTNTYRNADSYYRNSTSYNNPATEPSTLETSEINSLMGVLYDTENFGTFTSFVTLTNLNDKLDKQGPMTIFVPTDKAFAELGETTLSRISANPKMQKAIVMHHIAAGRGYVTDVEKKKRIKTALNTYIPVEEQAGELHLDGAKVVTADVYATNGIIHSIDQVMIPDRLKSELGVNENPNQPNRISNIMAMTSRNTSLDRIEGLIRQTNFDDELKDNGPYTLIAPTDRAFANLDERTRYRLSTDADFRREVAMAHIVPRLVKSQDILDATSIATLSNERLNIERRNNGVYLSDARVTQPNIPANNGVIHVVNKVIIPNREVSSSQNYNTRDDDSDNSNNSSYYQYGYTPNQ